MCGSGASAPHRLHLWPREESWTGGGRGGPGLTRLLVGIGVVLEGIGVVLEGIGVVLVGIGVVLEGIGVV